MNIIINIIENNPRRKDIALINGNTVELSDMPKMEGGRRQKIWALEARERLVSQWFQGILDMRYPSRLAEGDELDRFISAAQDILATDLLPLIAGKTDPITWTRVSDDNLLMKVCPTKLIELSNLEYFLINY